MVMRGAIQTWRLLLVPKLWSDRVYIQEYSPLIFVDHLSLARIIVPTPLIQVETDLGLLHPHQVVVATLARR